MNLQNYRIEFDESLNDWKVFGDIEDDSNSYVGSFGESGTLVGPWWVRQDDGFQLSIVQQYAVEIARNLVGSFSGGINLQEFSIVKVADTNDWKILGNIEDDNGNILATYGEDGTLVNSWWLSQSQEIQSSYVQRFAVMMAQQIMSGDAE
jgi:hypothetical protein